MATRQPLKSTSVLVVGAGVGGLTAALEFWRQGFTVRVLERFDYSSTAGDAFTIGPSATEVFRHWPDLAQQDRAISYEPLMAYHSISGERFRGPLELADLLSKAGIGEHAKPVQIRRHSRPKFHRMLLSQLEAIGVKVEYSCEVVGYGEDAEAGNAYAVLKSGERVTADLVVAADGVKGTSWPLVVGKPVAARSTGEAMYRAAFDVDLALQDPLVSERFQLTEDGKSVIEMWNGPGLNAVFWRCEDQMHFILTHPDQGDAEESWSQRTSPEEIMKYTSTVPGWPEVADRVIKLIPTEKLMNFKLLWREPQSTSASPAGLVVQIGDAAHTFLPSSGNGGTQAMEDAASLAACMAFVLGEEDSSTPSKAAKIAQAARIHQLLRYERVSCLQALGVSNRAKNRTPVNSKADVDKVKLHIPRWVVDHDPESYVYANFVAARDHLLHGAVFKNTNVPGGDWEYVPWTIDGLLAARDRGEKTILDGDWD